MVVIDASGVPRRTATPSPIPKLCLFEFVYFARPDTQPLRPERARGAPAHGRGARAPGAGRRRHGDAGARVGHPRGAGLRPRVGHPLRRRPGEEPLRRPHVHPAEPEACAARACGSSSTRCPRTSGASGSSSSTTRSCAAPRPARSSRCCARPAPPRCTSGSRRRRTAGRASTAWTPAGARELLAADLSVGEIRDYLGVDSLAYLDLDRLVDRHRRARPSRSAPPASPGEYPVPVPDARHQAGARGPGRADSTELTVRRPTT